MKKGTRIAKKSLALFLVVLMSINTFAAVVGDNNGAAFITKAEFDSLKNDFQSQLDTYNSSIDNKIDGAIANYLAGVGVAKTSSISLPLANWGTFTMMNGSVSPTFVLPDFNMMIDHQGRYISGDQTIMGYSYQTANHKGSTTKNLMPVVSNVTVSAAGFDETMPVWRGIGLNMRETWNLNKITTSPDDFGYGYSDWSNYLYLENFGTLDIPVSFNSDDDIWPVVPVYNVPNKTDMPWRDTYDLTTSFTNVSTSVAYEANENGEIWDYVHLGNWSRTNAWWCQAYLLNQCGSYCVDNHNDSSTLVDSLTKPTSYLYLVEAFTNGVKRNKAYEIKVTEQKPYARSTKKNTYSANVGRPVENKSPIPTIGLISDKLKADEIYQFEDGAYVDLNGNSLSPLTLVNGFYLMPVKAGYKYEWKAVFKDVKVNDAADAAEVNVLLAYEPFTDEVSITDTNNYVKLDGVAKGTPVKTDKLSTKINWTSENDGIVYLKFYPDIDDVSLSDDKWEVTLDLKQSSIYYETSTT